MPRRRDDDGKFTQSVSDEDILYFFTSGGRSFYSAQEVASEFNIGRSQAHRRLSELTDEGELEKVKIGNRNLVWWRPRDVVVLIEEEKGYSILDPSVGVASQGESRSDALRMLAEAIELHEREHSDIESIEKLHSELNIDLENIKSNKNPPWFEE